MDKYFLYITIIDILILAMMCVMASYNVILLKKQKHGFILSFVVIGLISIAEVITVISDGAALQFSSIHIHANYFGFAFTPLVPLLISYSIDSTKKIRFPLIFIIAYEMFLAISLPFGWVFYVDASNAYSRGPLFSVYLIVYLLSIAYLFWASIQMASKYHNRNRVLLYLLLAFLVFGTAVQVINPEIHVTWLCVTLVSVIYYNYCNELWQQVDGLTGILNHQSYLNYTASLNKDALLIIFDVDDFKQINDTYGHPVGDKCLISVAKCIRKAYGRHGYCYRIGGDEFCVLMFDASEIEKCNSDFCTLLEAEREQLIELPYVSIGTASFHRGDNIDDVKDKADQQMYLYKQQRKAEWQG